MGDCIECGAPVRNNEAVCAKCLDAEVAKSYLDVCVFGTGVLRLNSDNTATHIPLKDAKLASHPSAGKPLPKVDLLPPNLCWFQPKNKEV
jgi:hypothetical protein